MGIMTSTGENKKTDGSQTLLRGLDVVATCVDGPILLADLAKQLGLTRSTTHRLASALVERRYLELIPRQGYLLGPELLRLGFLAQRQTNIVQLARPHLEELAAETEDTLHLGILESDGALYLDKVSGSRRIQISSRIGDRHPLTATGLGKALLLDDTLERWANLFERDQAKGAFPIDYNVWVERMVAYAKAGHTFDLEENEDSIRCVAAPVRDVRGRIVAAISVSSAAQYMDDERMDRLAITIKNTADAIAARLGWTGKEAR